MSQGRSWRYSARRQRARATQRAVRAPGLGKQLNYSKTLLASRTLFAAALIFFCSSSWALSFISFDARSVAMGGAGVATARSHNASVFNPALLNNTRPARKARLYSHSYAGVRLIDRHNFIATAEAFDERYEDVKLKAYLEEAVDLRAMDFSDGNDLREASEKVRVLQADINQLSNKPLHAGASYGFSFGYPFGGWAVGGYHREFLVLGSVARIADADNAAIDYYVGAADQLAHLVDEVNAVAREVSDDPEVTLNDVVAHAKRLAPAVQALDDFVDFDRLTADAIDGALDNRQLKHYLRQQAPEQFHSTIETRGAEVVEQGLSLARTFPAVTLPGQLHVGVTLKQFDFTTISFTQRVNDFSLSDYRNEQHRRAYRRRANLDVGALYDLSQRWQVGLVVRNLLTDTFSTAQGDQLLVRPSARLGLGYVAPQLRLSLDVDLTRNEALSFDPDKQYLSLGAEWFLWRNTALRAGARTNLVSGEVLPSLGLGIGGHRGHLDIAFARSLNADEWAASVQAGLAF